MYAFGNIQQDFTMNSPSNIKVLCKLPLSPFSDKRYRNNGMSLDGCVHKLPAGRLSSGKNILLPCAALYQNDTSRPLHMPDSTNDDGLEEPDTL